VIEPEKTAWHSFLGKVEETLLAKVSEEVKNYVREAVATSGQVVPNWTRYPFVPVSLARASSILPKKWEPR
jgi:hypothetical protein